jgi:hypothetical protein
MKIRRLFAPLLLGVLAQTLTVKAGDLYLVNISGTCRAMNEATDRMIIRSMSTATIIRDCALAHSNSPVNIRELRLAYDPDTDKISVVNYLTGQTVCDFVTFGEPSIAANFADTLRAMHVYLFNPPHVDGGIGSLVLSERIVRDKNGVATRIIASGNFHYIVRATDTHQPEICVGTLSLGRKFTLPSSAPPAP